MDRIEIFMILKYGNEKEKQELRRALGEEQWEEMIKLWKNLGK